MINKTVTEFTSTSLALDTTANGSLTCFRGSEPRQKLMAPFTRATFTLARSTEEGSTSGWTGRTITVNGGTTRLTGTAFTFGRTVASTKAAGNRTSSITRAPILGRMVDGTKAAMTKTKSMAGESTCGPMARSTKDIGIMGNSTARGASPTIGMRAESEFGSTEIE